MHELASIEALNALVDFFGCGSVYMLPSKAARYQIENLDEILTKIIPVFNQEQSLKFNTIKQVHFEIFVKVCELIKKNGYKSDKDLQLIVDLAWDMNKEGKNRRISKAEYLAKFIKDLEVK